MNAYLLTDQRLHTVSQLLARLGRTFAAPQEDDSHTNIAYDALGDRLVGRWVDTPKGRFTPVIRLSDWSFVWSDERRMPAQTIGQIGKTPREVLAEIAGRLGEIGLEEGQLFEPMHYEIPAYSEAKGSIRMIPFNELDVWREWRELANVACREVLEALQADGEVRIWPHHFDTGVFVPANERVSIGFGLAMADQVSDSPYFYASAYLSQGEMNFAEAPSLPSGRWVSGESFSGAILPIDPSTNAFSNKGRDTLRRFTIGVLRWYLTH